MRTFVREAVAAMSPFAILILMSPTSQAQDLGKIMQVVGAIGIKVAKDMNATKSDNGGPQTTAPLSSTDSDVSGPSQIPSYEIAGVKLGMSEEEAKVALRRTYPLGYTDSRGPRRLSFEPYILRNPYDNKTNVHGGFFASLLGKNEPSGLGYNYVWVATYENKVWAVWRYELTAKYDYDKSLPQFIAKYPGAKQDQYAGSLHGLRLSEGNCINLPLSHQNEYHVDLDDAYVGQTCHKIFSYKFDVDNSLGIKSLSRPSAQMADVDLGRQFYESMKNSARNAEVARQEKRGSAQF